MIDGQVEIKGLTETVSRLSRADQITDKHNRKAMERSLAVLQLVAQTYPTAPSGSSYKRTGTLGRRWQLKVTGLLGGVTGIIANPTPYAPYVMGEGTQAWMHKGRWKTTGQIVKEKQSQVLDFFDQAVKDITKELGG